MDILFFERGALYQISSEWSGIGWLALNMLVLLVGWVVIVIGVTRLVGGVAQEGLLELTIAGATFHCADPTARLQSL